MLTDPQTNLSFLLKALQHTALQEWLPQVHQLQLSDLHFSAMPSTYRLQARQQGQLILIGDLPLEIGKRLIQKLKSACKMNIAESRTPQDGRLQFAQTEARLATHPTLHGESLSIRLLGMQGFDCLTALELSAPTTETIHELFAHSEGLLLVSGPTGSGKTTLLHAGLNSLGKLAGRTVTLEDPVEIRNNNALQTDLSLLPHLTYAGGLRSLMRQDPDTILIGEIRDRETAELCLNASLTGHRVLATVHAPDCMGTLYRMQELGIALKTLFNCLNGVINLRLKQLPEAKKRRLSANLMNFKAIPKSTLLGISSLSDLDLVLTQFNAKQAHA